MLKPLEDKVIVRRDAEEKVTPSGFLLTNIHEEKQGSGVVISVGPGLILNNGDKVIPEVDVGDRVAFSKYQGTEIDHDGETLIILSYRDILAILG